MKKETILNLEKATDKYVRYQLALATFLNLKFWIADAGNVISDEKFDRSNYIPDGYSLEEMGEAVEDYILVDGNYSVYACPITPFTSASQVLGPSVILSTFDQRTERMVKFLGVNYYIYDVTF